MDYGGEQPSLDTIAGTIFFTKKYICMCFDE